MVYDGVILLLQFGQDLNPAPSKIEGLLRGSLLKLQYADACMKPLPKGSALPLDYITL